MNLRRLVLVGNAHIDIAYRWRVNETVLRVLPDTVRGVLEMMDEHPSLTFAQSQLFLYEKLAELYPRLLERVHERVAEGRWVCVGGSYVEPDAVLPGGESVLRQLLVGRVVAERLGLPPDDLAWIPDSFTGHAHTLPQLLAGCGIRSYVLNRGCPDGVRAFFWKGPDGSEVFAYKIPKHYNVTLGREAVEAARAWCEIAGIDETMVLYGEGDHGGGPRNGDLDAIAEMASAGIEVEHGVPRDVVEAARAAREDWPVVEGDLGIPAGSMVHRGPMVSQAKIKRANRRLEHHILAAERIATLGSVLQRKNFFHRLDMRAAWSALLVQQFHDTLPGTLAGDAADDAIRDLEWVSSQTGRLASFGMEVIGSRMDTRGDGVPFVVVNPAPYERDATIALPCPGSGDPQSCSVSGPDGERSPAVAVPGEDEVSVVVRGLPALGAALYRLHTDETATTQAPSLNVSHDTRTRRISNDALEVEYGPAGIEQITDLRTGFGLLRDTGNVVTLHEESESSSWHLSLTGTSERVPLHGPDVVFSHDHGVRVRWTGEFGDSRVTTELTVTPGEPWLAFTLRVDWHEADRLLRVSFPLSVHASQSRYEAPLGWIDRPADGTEWPSQSFVAHGDGHGAAAIINEGTYGASVEDDVVALSVVRGARDMDPRMDEGCHEVRYAFAPLPANPAPSALFRLSALFTMPVHQIRERRHGGALPNWGGRTNDWSLPPRVSFFRATPENVFVSALKISEDDWNPQHLILRVKETDGVPAEATVVSAFPMGSVVETDHIERVLASQKGYRLDDTALRIELGPHQIRTFRISLRGGPEGG